MNILIKLTQKIKSLYLLGDFNINILHNGKSFLEKHKDDLSELSTLLPIHRQYKEFCSYNSLKQLITSPTRVSCHSSTLIDHILTNTPQKIVQSGIIETAISDHQLIFCTRKTTKNKFHKHKCTYSRCFKNYTKEKFENELTSINFPNYSEFRDVNLAYNDFIKKLMNTIDTCAPKKEGRVKNSSQEWFDREIKDSMLARNKLFKKFKKSRLEENIGKRKELWKVIKSLGMPSKNVASGSIISLKDRNGELKFENKENANILKSFFENLATNLVNKLPDAPKRFNKTSTISFYKDLDITKKNFLFHSVDFDTVLDILSSINPHKVCGIDDIAGRFLKDGASILAKPITQIFNLSIKLSIFPNNCKVAKLKPLYKKGSRSDPKNYRPISLLPLVSKVFEKLIHQQLQKYLDENKILYSFQSGFRANHSTDSCISYLQDKIVTGFDKGMLTGMIAIDLQKAFDTIDHTILLEKLSCLGLSNQVIGWLESYLCDRKFYVNIFFFFIYIYNNKET